MECSFCFYKYLLLLKNSETNNPKHATTYCSGHKTIMIWFDSNIAKDINLRQPFPIAVIETLHFLNEIMQIHGRESPSIVHSFKVSQLVSLGRLIQIRKANQRFLGKILLHTCLLFLGKYKSLVVKENFRDKKKSAPKS